MLNFKQILGRLYSVFAWIYKHRIRFIIYPIVTGFSGLLGFLVLVATFHSDLKLNGTYDAAVVFFGGFDESNSPNSETKSRLKQAIEFCSNGMSRHLMIVGGNRKRLSKSGSELLAQVAIESGYPEENIQVGATSYDTVSNVREIKQLAAAKGWRKLLLISSPLHVMRISWLFGQDKSMKINFASEDITSYFPRSGLFVGCLHEWIGYVSVFVLPDHYRNALVVWWRG
jgi:uncharacterized SAM-binding protein YcdF (DUF218 family)